MRSINHCNYDKVRLLHDITRLTWFLDKHTQKDANEAGHILCNKMYMELQRDLELYAEKLRLAIEGLSRENKFN